MRRQVQRLAMMMAFIAVVATLAVSLYVAISDIRGLEQRQVELEASWLLATVTERYQSGLPITDAMLSHSVVTGSALRVVGPDGLDASVRSNLQPEYFSATASNRRFTVTVSHDDRRVRDAVGDALIGAAAVSAVTALAAWLMASWWGRRMERVLDEFVQTAQDIGSGDGRMRGRRFGMPELDEVAEVLDATSARIEDLLVLERRLVAEVSHQLRTPMTALSLQLEEVAAVAEDPAQVRAAIAAAERQLDRMSAVVSELIAVRRGESFHNGTRRLSEVLRPVLDEARASLSIEDRQLEEALDDQLFTNSAPGAIRHVVSILLENAQVHGSGKVTVCTSRVADWIEVAVSDQGTGLSQLSAAALRSFDRTDLPTTSSKSIGLALAAALTAAQGGKLEWRDNEPSTIRLHLPFPLVEKDQAPVGEKAEHGS